MKILILGANSFIGKYYKKFSKLNNILLASSKKKNNNIHFNIILHDIKKIILKYKITHVVFLTAISNPRECQNNIRQSNLINVLKTKEVINQLIKKNIYFIFFSSEYVFNGRKGNYIENSKTNSKILYGKQKIKLEKFLEKKRKKNFSIMRIAKTFGDEIKDKSIFTNFLKDYLKNKREFVFANDQRFSALYVKDLIKIIDIFIKKKIIGKFNICGDENYTRINYFNKIVKNLKLKNIKIIGKKFKYLSNLKKITLNI